MAVRSGSAVWEGDLKAGKGTLKVGKGAYEGPYSFSSRFEEGAGTNPEELIGAAHAACFSMAFANALSQAGYIPTRVETTAMVTLSVGLTGPAIGPIELMNTSAVPEISPEKFQEIAHTAKNGCPVSKALAGVEIKLDARLV